MGEKYFRRQAMKKILILVEGQTEETFVKDILFPHLEKKSIYCIPKLATTKRVRSGPDFKGGIVSYGKLEIDIKRLLTDTSTVAVTTMIDYYGFSTIVPFKVAIKGGSCFERVILLEKMFKENIGHKKFLPYLQLHEFEALVFVSPGVVTAAFKQEDKEAAINKIKSSFKTVEEINDNPATVPSRRLLTLFPSYQKTLHGPLIVKRTGLETIRKECSHFNQWLTQLENL
jgi:hypothetical protein